MQQADLPEFSYLMLSVGKIYGKTLSKECIELFWLSLQVYPIESVRFALQQHVGNQQAGQFFPKPADVLRMLHAGAESQAHHAWDSVIAALGHTGMYGDVRFDDPLVAVILRDIGGWMRLCRSQAADLPFKQKQFLHRYLHYLQQPPVLISDNRADFYGIISRCNGSVLTTKLTQQRTAVHSVIHDIREEE